MGLSGDKEQARLRAMQLFFGADLRLRKHHSRAEALLLAWYKVSEGIASPLTVCFLGDGRAAVRPS